MLTAFKHLFKSEDELSKDLSRIRQFLLESLCQSFTRLIPHVSDSFKSTLDGQPTEDDILSILRGDTKGKPDLCYDHFNNLVNISRKLSMLERIATHYRLCHSMMLIIVVSSLFLTISGASFQSSRGYCALISIFLLLLQVFIIVKMRSYTGMISRIEENL